MHAVHAAKAITLAAKMAFQHFVVDRVDCNIGDGDNDLVRAGRDDVDSHRVVGAHPATQCSAIQIEHGKRAATDTNGFPNSTPTAAIMISEDMSAAAAAAPWSEAAGLSLEHHASSVDISAGAAVRANVAHLRGGTVLLQPQR